MTLKREPASNAVRHLAAAASPTRKSYTPFVSLILLNKTYRVLSQFTDPDGRATLADFITAKNVYPAGRLDYDSEGLLLLTDNGPLQARIAEPSSTMTKSYWAQVEGIPNDWQLSTLCSGVRLKDGAATAVEARLIDEPAPLWPREPPIRGRKTVPTRWIEISINEGRNRQVRRMTAAVNLPTLRLIRHRIGPWSLDGLRPGESRELSDNDAWDQIRS